MKNRAFTIIELLVAISIVAILTAIVLPVLLTARAKARQAACVSNLHQLGMAIALYAQDSDQVYPEGIDPEDKFTDIWQTSGGGQFANVVPHLQLLSELLNPYSKNQQIWDCPSDSGFNQIDIGFGPVPFKAHPSSYAEYGMSYYYRTEIGLRHLSLSGLIAYDNFPPYVEHGPAEIDVLFDGAGSWHGGSGQAGRYDVLMGDGHVANMTYAVLANTSFMVFTRPNSPPPPSN